MSVVPCARLAEVVQKLRALNRDVLRLSRLAPSDLDLSEAQLAWFEQQLGVLAEDVMLAQLEQCQMPRPRLLTGQWNTAWQAARPVRMCQIEGCGRIHEAKGYCKRHYKALVSRAGRVA